MRFFTLCLLLCGLLIVSSCSYKQDQLLFQEKNAVDSARQKQAVTLATYKIQPQDVLQVKNLQNNTEITGNLNGGSVSGGGGSTAPAGAGTSQSTGGDTYQVEEDGTVALPAIGRIPVVGLTRMEATKKIEDLYRQSLLKAPIIEVKVVNLKVTMLGEVKAQGNFSLLKDKTTLIEIIGEAGGLTDKANESDIQIIRGEPGSQQVINVDLRNINTINNPETILQNGDIIYVAENKRAIRADKISTFSTVIQPVIIILSAALVVFTLARNK